MRVIIWSNAGMKGQGKRGDLREYPPTNGTVRHDSHMRKSGVTRPGIEPGSHGGGGGGDEQANRSAIMASKTCLFLMKKLSRLAFPEWAEVAGALTTISSTHFPYDDEADFVTAFRREVAHIDGSRAADGISRLSHRWQRTVDNLGDHFEGCRTAIRITTTRARSDGCINSYTHSGATVAERLARSPPTKAIRVTPDFRLWESCRAMPLVGGFFSGSPALSFRRCSIPTSITLIGSQDLDVKSRPYLFTHSYTLSFATRLSCQSFPRRPDDLATAGLVWGGRRVVTSIPPPHPPPHFAETGLT
ncbi:hypothetical protein PR048_024693 [Dryococelus australis]|uniref:Uncharacterized protein n=1 Tax=Dryococelus australis TaxID=614101 RepID=A0ABQ9GP94_9NEOP|nr:hypothetical protein PR048_024693 [Dryococelus australis]